MVEPVPKSVRNIWDDWNIRILILLSLSLQTFLILCAPIRKRTSNMWIMSLIWSAYLLADWVANFAIGLIASSEGRAHGGGPIDVQLLAFWAPFLLIHLGGPETIISFSLEDNAFWQRHLLGLLFQIVATLYVFLQSLGPNNKLWFATLVLFVTGIIKYAERTRALYLGSLDGLKNSLKKEDYLPKKKDKEKLVLQSTDSRDQVARHRYEDRYHNIAVVRCAYDFFELSRGLLADLVISEEEAARLVLSPSRRSPEEAFHIIAVELNFIYETLFTKLYVAHTKEGYFFRAVSFVATSIGLVCFYKFDKHGLHRVDVVISYTLLFGAMALDSIALLMLIISDWTVPAAKELLKKHDSWQSSCVTSILLKYLDLKSPQWSSNTTSSFLGRSRQNLCGRYSQSIYTFNLIEESPNETLPSVIGHNCRTFCLKTMGLFGFKDLLDKIKYRSSKPLSKDLWNFIYNDLREKAMMGNPSAFSKQWEARVSWIRDRMPCIRKELSPFLGQVDYQQTLLLWHIATELCYRTYDNAHVDNGPREYGKTLSDYMLYLLLMQPIMMSTVARVELESVLNIYDKCEFQAFVREESEQSEQAVESEQSEQAVESEQSEQTEESEQAEQEAACHEAVCLEIPERSPSVKPEEASSSVKPEASSSVKPEVSISSDESEESRSSDEPDENEPLREVAKLGDKNWDSASDAPEENVSFPDIQPLWSVAKFLAKELKKLGDEKWDIMSQVWVQLLSYAASNCRSYSHAQSLSTGGELLTFVWFALIHMGIQQDSGGSMTSIPIHMGIQQDGSGSMTSISINSLNNPAT